MILYTKIRRLAGKIYNNYKYLFYFLLSLVFKDKYLFIKAWIEIEHGVCSHRNWGDELNEILSDICRTKRLSFCNDARWNALSI